MVEKYLKMIVSLSGVYNVMGSLKRYMRYSLEKWNDKNILKKVIISKQIRI